MKRLAQYSYINLCTNVSAVCLEQNWLQKPEVIIFFLTYLIYDWLSEIFAEILAKGHSQKCG